MTETHVIRPRPPFSFGQALAFLRRFPPTLGDRLVSGAAVLGAARVNGQTLGFRVEGAEDSDAAVLRCRFWDGQEGALSPSGDVDELAIGAIGLDGRQALLARIGDWLGVDDDLGPFYAAARDDRPFWALVERVYGYHQVRFFTPFENACWAILGQRTPFAAARAAKRRLVERYGDTVEIEGQMILAFPEPADLAGAERDALATIVSSERKADRLLAIARAFAERGDAALSGMSTEALGAWLQALPGIGPWSVVFILLRGFGRADAALPLGTTETFDRELLQAGRAVYGASVTADDLATLAARYGPYQGWWGHYLRVGS